MYSNQPHNNKKSQEEEEQSLEYVVHSDAEEEHASIEISIEATAENSDPDFAKLQEENVSNGTIVINEVPYHKAVPNQWRKQCKNHFEEFWKEYFYMLFDDLNSRYHEKFVELKLDDIRCIPFIQEKHLLMFVHMITSDAQRAMQMIQRFNQNKDIFFEWVSNTCQCPQYISNFADAGILTWNIFAKQIVTKSDLNDIIPENQKNNNFDRQMLWRNIPKDVWNYYKIDRNSTISKRHELASFTPSPLSIINKTNNLAPDISWNKTNETPKKIVEILWVFFLILLLIFDIVIAVLIVYRYFIDSDVPKELAIDIMPYLLNNVLNPMHFIIQLLLILSWMEWLIFVKQNKCTKYIRWIIVTFLFVTVFVLMFNVIIYFIESKLSNQDFMHRSFMLKIDEIQTSTFYRNTWFILNGMIFVIISFVIGFISIGKIMKENIKHLALRKAGENKIVKNLSLERNSDIFCNWYKLFSYLSLTVVKYLLLTILINILMFMQTGIWLYLRYIKSPNITNYEITNDHDNQFKIIIFGSDMLCVSFGILLVCYLKKQRINYEKIEEMHHSKRKFSPHSTMPSEDEYGHGFFNNPPIL